MKSKSFSRCKRFRCKTKSFQTSIKYFKTSRSRRDRRLNKIILKTSDINDVNLCNIIRMSGERDVL